MVLLCSLAVAGTIFSLALAHAPVDLGKRAPFQAFGIEKNEKGFEGEAVGRDEYQPGFAPPSQFRKKNATIPQLKDRSLDLMDRQSCNADYWYCSAFGRCCPRTSNCCSYGYCIDPADTCCPNGPCDPGWNCCGANCSPKGADCCSDGNYCEAGNICVKLLRTGRIVCCTDLQCTAAVVSGTTTYATTTSREDPATITAPPAVTSQVVIVGDSYTTYYWTVTWWYLSFYWTTFQRVESTVTYTRIYETTTFTTTATDVIQASSLFSALSVTLTFEPPPAAQTSLASLLIFLPSDTSTFNGLPSDTSTFNVLPSDTGTLSFDDTFTSFPNGPEETDSSSSSSSSSSTLTSARTTSTASLAPVNTGPGDSVASGLLVQWTLVGLGAVSGVLMMWL